MPSIKIGPHLLPNRTALAPMAGITDLPFRRLCQRFGAGLVVSEMVSSDSSLRHSRKSRNRLRHDDEQVPRSVQIVGNDPQEMAAAARFNEGQGAQIIDINMGCPAKKVCKKAAGSALMRDERLVRQILEAVVVAVAVPVTLKIRTGWSLDARNGVAIAKLAEDCGIQALAVHGRTRSCRFAGQAEYDTIADIVEAVSMPVYANGDVDSAAKAKVVLDHTGATGIMIGRAAQGRPWIFNEINQYLANGTIVDEPDIWQQRELILGHLQALHGFYGDLMGARIARKHVGWYLQQRDSEGVFRRYFNTIDCAASQREALYCFFDGRWSAAG